MVADRGGSAAAQKRSGGDDEEWNNDEAEEAEGKEGTSEEEDTDSEGKAVGSGGGGSSGSSESAEIKQRRLLTSLAEHHSSLGMPIQSAEQLSIDEIEAEKVRLMDSARVGYEHCLEHFSNSEMSAILASTFYRHHYMFQTQECLCLARALKRSPSMDTRFYIYSRLRRLNESDGSGLGPIERLMFD